MIRLFLVVLMLLAAAPGRAELNIEITQGVDNPTAIAVVPFGWRGFGKPETDITRIISNDLQRVGVFEPIAREDMLSLPQSSKEVFYRDWRAVGAEYLVVGKMSKLIGPEIQVDYELIDVYRQKKLFHKRAKGTEESIRDMAHAIADQVYEQLTGIPGAFSTRIAYVSSNARGNGKFDYRLMLSDSDGYRPKILLQSPEPILSPAWSPDGKSLAYVSFEGKKPAIYSHELATRKRVKLTDFSGINGAPAWSPDGRRLAVVLSKDGNPDIFTLEIETRKLQKVVSHFAIDTEPSWTTDGSGIIFTSDRGGLPQIYHLDLSSRRVKRLTFEGDYNARARVLPDGTGFVMIHRQAGNFHVALQKYDTGRIWILSQTQMDESPTVAPNGSMLMYATQYGGKGILAAVSVDGGVKYRLPSVSSDVREPAWSPF